MFSMFLFSLTEQKKISFKETPNLKMFVLLSLFLSSKGFKYMYHLYEQIFERERERAMDSCKCWLVFISLIWKCYVI